MEKRKELGTRLPVPSPKPGKIGAFQGKNGSEDVMRIQRGGALTGKEEKRTKGKKPWLQSKSPRGKSHSTAE